MPLIGLPISKYPGDPYLVRNLIKLHMQIALVGTTTKIADNDGDLDGCPPTHIWLPVPTITVPAGDCLHCRTIYCPFVTNIFKTLPDASVVVGYSHYYNERTVHTSITWRALHEAKWEAKT